MGYFFGGTVVHLGGDAADAVVDSGLDLVGVEPLTIVENTAISDTVCRGQYSYRIITCHLPYFSPPATTSVRRLNGNKHLKWRTDSYLEKFQVNPRQLFKCLFVLIPTQNFEMAN